MSATPVVPILKNERHEAFAHHLANGASKTEAAKLAGFSPTRAKFTGCNLGKRPDVRERVREISATRATVDRRAQEKSAYDRTAAMEEADEVRRLAISKRDASTALKATELKAKLMGLMIDRHEIRSGPLDGLSLERQMQLLEMVTGLLEHGTMDGEATVIDLQPEGEPARLEAGQGEGAKTGSGLTILGGEALNIAHEDLERAEAPKL